MTQKYNQTESQQSLPKQLHAIYQTVCHWHKDNPPAYLEDFNATCLELYVTKNVT